MHIFFDAVAAGLDWLDADGVTVLTSAAANDVGIYNSALAKFVRVGNIMGSTGLRGQIGPEGPAGPTGPQGPPGSASNIQAATDAIRGIVLLAISTFTGHTDNSRAATPGYVNARLPGNASQVARGLIKLATPTERNSANTATPNAEVALTPADFAALRGTLSTPTATTGRFGTVQLPTPTERAAGTATNRVPTVADVTAMITGQWVRYANEAALPTTVPAGKVAWFPET